MLNYYRAQNPRPGGLLKMSIDTLSEYMSRFPWPARGMPPIRPTICPTVEREYHLPKCLFREVIEAR
jgi:hypothetical protein